MSVKAYIAILLSRCSVDTVADRPLWQEDVVLVHGRTEAEARGRAESRGRGRNTSYANEAGEVVSWTFERVVDVAEVQDTDFSLDADLYTRSFRDYEAYARFEPMLSGEEA